MNRRAILFGIGGAAALTRSTLATPTQGESQLIGLSLEDVIANWGELGDPVERTDLSPFPMYQIGAQTWLIHIAFQPTANGEVATFAQFDAIADKGVDWVDANQLVMMVLPTDASFAESYTMQATPDGPLMTWLGR